MDRRVENIIEITWILKDYVVTERITCIPHTELVELISDWSEQFEEEHLDADWNELDYNEEIIKFVNLNTAKELWDRFEDVPMNPDTEEIEKECSPSLKTFCNILNALGYELKIVKK